MPICHDKKILFVHVPKNAGSTIESALNLLHKDKLYDTKKHPIYNVCPQHLYASEILNICPSAKDYYKFAVVRSPFVRLLSEFFYQHDTKTMIHDIVKKMNFEQFLDYCFSLNENDRMFLFDRHLECQYKFLDVQGIEIFKFERLEELFNKFNIPNNLHLRKSNGVYDLSMFSDKYKKMTLDFYKKDFELYYPEQL